MHMSGDLYFGSLNKYGENTVKLGEENTRKVFVCLALISPIVIYLTVLSLRSAV